MLFLLQEEGGGDVSRARVKDKKPEGRFDALGKCFGCSDSHIKTLSQT